MWLLVSPEDLGTTRWCLQSFHLMHFSFGENVSGDVVQRGWGCVHRRHCSFAASGGVEFQVRYELQNQSRAQQPTRTSWQKHRQCSFSLFATVCYITDWQTTELLLLNWNISWHVKFHVSCCWTCLMFGCWQSCWLASFRSRAPISTEVYPVACSAQALLFSSSVWDSNGVLPEYTCSLQDITSQKGTLSWQVLFACLTTSEKLLRKPGICIYDCCVPSKTVGGAKIWRCSFNDVFIIINRTSEVTCRHPAHPKLLIVVIDMPKSSNIYTISWANTGLSSVITGVHSHLIGPSTVIWLKGDSV